MLQYFVLLLFLVNDVACNFTSKCDKKDIASSYLNAAIDMINKAKSNIPTNLVVDTEINSTWKPTDCADILHMGHTTSGVHTIWPMNRLIEDKSLNVYCDMNIDGGGWTVIQRRGNYGNPIDYFFKEWKSYKDGFGDIQKEFWLGNDNIFALTNQKLYSVRFDLQDSSLNKSYALYDYFWIDDELNNYTLHIAEYSGYAGDSMDYHNNMKFSTKDVKNDKKKSYSCATRYKSGWWFNSCHHSNLNGLYRVNESSKGVNWDTWKGLEESLESAEIKIRPKKFTVKKFV